MHGGGDSGFEEALIRDYERVATLGAKIIGELSQQDPERGHAALERLIASGLAVEQHGAIALRRPEDCPAPFSTSLSSRMRSLYLEWLRADRPLQPARPAGETGVPDEEGTAIDELLYGELGFWQHWWNRIRERDYEAHGPLPMDIVVPDDGGFEARPWLSEFDPQIRSYVLDGGLLRGRAIVPPQALKSAVEPLLDLSTESGFEVRLLSTDARFVLYDGCVAVLSEAPGRHRERTQDQPEPYWAMRQPAVVDPLRHSFELLWASAIPFRASRGEYDAILELLALGYTDARIAQDLKLSVRTVSRRVSEIMAEHETRSRFELGMLHERSRRDS